MLGDLLVIGKGVQESETLANYYDQKAADVGDAEAQFFFGCHLLGGTGVQKDEALAVDYFRKSAAQENANAQFALGSCLLHARGVQRNEALACDYFRKAADQGSARAQSELGMCLFHGLGVQKNEALAVQFMQKAADQGWPGAASCLERISSTIHASVTAVAADMGPSDVDLDTRSQAQKRSNSPEVVEKVSSVLKKHKQSDENGSSASNAEKLNQSAQIVVEEPQQPQQKTKPRLVVEIDGCYEGENDGAPFYHNLIQNVVVKEFRGRGQYGGYIVGLPNDACVWSHNELHEKHDIEEQRDWRIGDQVQFLVTKARYGTDRKGERVLIEDGGQIKKRTLWCKGTIIEKRDDYVIEHVAWDERDPAKTTSRHVSAKNIRSPF